MASRAAQGHDRAFSISAVISRAFGVLADNPVTVFGISFLIGVLPLQVFEYFLRGQQPNPTSPTEMLAYGALAIASGLIAIVLGTLVQAAIVRATSAFARGERAGFGESIAAGAAKALPLFGLVVLMFLALIMGFLFLIVPGIILYLVWIVAAPALVEENLGIIDAFRRSAELTKGARWRIFGLMVLVFVMIIIFGSVAGLLLVFTGNVGTLAQQMAGGQLPVFFLIFTAVSNTLTAAFNAAIQTSLYIGLRDWKEGPEADTLGEVFA